MLRIRKGWCLGCGLCAESCPQQAISLLSGQAEINQSLCNQCRFCLEVCPQGAIIEMVSVSEDELQVTITSLKQKANDLMERIENLKKPRY